MMLPFTDRLPLPRIFGRTDPSPLPLDMFDHHRMADEARAARKLEKLYHRGQDRAWNGKEVLQELLDKHGGVDLPDRQAEAIRNIFAVILWGELAAWKVSAALALRLEPLEAKMAATSQAHDEARHFYVMHDYLSLLGEVPKNLRPRTKEVLLRVLHADSSAKMLLGMQLMVEPMALTLFKLVRDRQLDPVLSDLLVRFEEDEARHVGLGTLYLPTLLEQLNPLETMELARWQLQEYYVQFEMLKELRRDFVALGIPVREVFELGRQKQVFALKMLADEMGGRAMPFVLFFLRLVDFKKEIDFPQEDAPPALRHRIRRGVRAAMHTPTDLKERWGFVA